LYIRKLLQLLEKRTYLQAIDAILHYISTADNHVSSSSKILLDVGCGKGNLAKSLVNVDKPVLAVSYTLGIDIFLPSLLIAKKVYDDVLRCDIRFLPFRDASCDIVLASQIIEHLSKNDGLTLIKDLERISKGKIIITVPVGYNPKRHLEDDDPWQIHKSAWHPDEFKTRGFKVYGYAGARFLLGERGEFKIKSRMFAPFLFAMILLTQLITRKFVTASYQMLCIKNVKH